jgi:RNA polymerase sigma factor for flagellar operon FliA
MITTENRIHAYTSVREATDDTVERYMPLVRHIASKFTYNLPPMVDYDDLVSIGLVGLLDALSRYDPARGIKFETFATYRVRGAILNQLSALSWVPRGVREKSKKLEKTVAGLSDRLGRMPTGEEISGEAGLTAAQYEKILAETGPVSFIPIDAMSDTEESNLGLSSLLESPELLVEGSLRVERVAACIRQLPEKERLTVTLYFYEDLTLKEIGHIMGVSESRACQLLSQSMIKIRGMIGREGEL